MSSQSQVSSSSHLPATDNEYDQRLVPKILLISREIYFVLTLTSNSNVACALGLKQDAFASSSFAVKIFITH
jgi:hypothetical protein